MPAPPSGTPGNLNPPSQAAAPPSVAGEGCSAPPTCVFDAAHAGGIGGNGNAPGGWTVTIRRPGRLDRIVISSHGGYEAYPCGTVRAGDHVTASAGSGSSVFAGDPAICF